MATKNKRQASRHILDETRTRLRASLHMDIMFGALPLTAICTFLMVTYPDFDIDVDMKALDIYAIHGRKLLLACLSMMFIAIPLLKRWRYLASGLATSGWLCLLVPAITFTAPWLDAAESRFLPTILIICIGVTLCALASLMGNGLLLATTYLPRRSGAR